MNKKTEKKRDWLKSIFDSVAEGDIKTISITETNISSLRTRAGQLNRAAGYQKYKISVDSLLRVVRIANGV